MNRHGIGKLQLLLQGIGIVHDAAAVELYRHLRGKIIDLADNAHIAVKDTGAVIDGDTVPAAYLPFQLIIVADLHNLIAAAEQPLPEGMLGLVRRSRIKISLKDLIQPFDAEGTLLHRHQDLDIGRRRTHIGGKPAVNETDHLPDDRIRVMPLQEKEIPAARLQRDLAALVDGVGIDDDGTALALPEDPAQAHGRKHLRPQQITQHIAGSHRGQLIGIADQDKT